MQCVLAAWTTAVACRESGGDSSASTRSISLKTMTSPHQIESHGLVLTVEVMERQAGGITLRYHILNRNQYPVFLLNTPVTAWTGRGRATVDIERCVVEIMTDSVHAAQKMAAVPEGKLVEAMIIPAAMQLDPGQQMERRLRLTLPLAASNPYLEQKPGGRSLTVERALYFEVGYFPGTPESARLATKLSTNAGEFLYFDPMPDTAQKFLITGPLGISVPVRMESP